MNIMQYRAAKLEMRSLFTKLPNVIPAPGNPEWDRFVKLAEITRDYEDTAAVKDSLAPR